MVIMSLPTIKSTGKYVRIPLGGKRTRTTTNQAILASKQVINLQQPGSVQDDYIRRTNGQQSMANNVR